MKWSRARWRCACRTAAGPSGRPPRPPTRSAAVGFTAAVDGDAELTATTTAFYAPGSEPAAQLVARHLTSKAVYVEDASLDPSEVRARDRRRLHDRRPPAVAGRSGTPAGDDHHHDAHHGRRLGELHDLDHGGADDHHVGAHRVPARGPAAGDRVLRASLFALGAVASAACGGGGDDEGGELARRVTDAVAGDDGALAERLQEQGLAVPDGGVELSEVACPTTPATSPDDRMTCRASVEDIEVAVDVEFGDAGQLSVVGLTVQP